jgi:biotin carboxyl carrier protein
VDEGDLVVTGQMVCQVESMKTMFPLYAPQGGRVFYVTELGEIVAEGDTIFEVEVE